MIYLIIIIALILLYIILTYNKIIKAKNKVNDAFAVMDVYLKKRWDLIPSIIETVKGYANHEKNTLKEVIEIRGNNYDNLNTTDKISKNTSLAPKIEKLMVLAENYPELKASENFRKLSDNLTKIEDEIAHSRKYYNATIRDFNNLIQTFPNNIIAHIFREKPKDMFAANENEKENIKVEL